MTTSQSKGAGWKSKWTDKETLCMNNSVLWKHKCVYMENVLKKYKTVSRWWWTPWCLCAASCVRCPAQPPRDSARPSRPSPNKFRSLAPPSATPSWSERPRTSTERWSKRQSWWNGSMLSLQLWYWFIVILSHSPLVREVKLSVVSYLTNSIVDQILQELYTTHKTLVLVITLFCMTSL